jgi:hypothetical protein
MTAVDLIAARFESELRRETGDDYAKIIEANKTSGSVCHSHDYTDANELMVRAFVKTMGYEPELCEDDFDDTMPNDGDMMESAWSLWRSKNA